MLNSRRFIAGTQFRWKGLDHEIKLVLPGDRVNIQDTSTLVLSTIPVGELLAALFKGELALY